MIPTILHRIWLGKAPIPREFQTWWKQFKALNPEWEFRTWRDRDLEWIVNRDVFDESPTMSERSDVARFEILAKHGGIYVDTDVEPLRPLDQLTRHEAFAGWEYSNRLGTAVLGGAPGHPALQRLIDELPAWAEMHEGDRPDERTGPLFLTTMWWGYDRLLRKQGKRSDIMRYPRETFYPYGWWPADAKKANGPFPSSTILVHHWRASWVQK